MQTFALCFIASALVGAAFANSLNDCLCSKELRLVCGNDGVTYSNPCMIDCARTKGLSSKGLELEIASRGPCDLISEKSLPGTCACNRALKPVCGTDGRSYMNECLLECAKDNGSSPKGDALAVKHEGECSAFAVMDNKCICPLFWTPVCGNDGVTYKNICFLNCTKNILGGSLKGADLAAEYDGECEEELELSDNSDYWDWDSESWESASTSGSSEFSSESNED